MGPTISSLLLKGSVVRPWTIFFNRSYAASTLFQVQRPKLKLCEQNFWFRSTRIANLAPSYVDITDFGSRKAFFDGFASGLGLSSAFLIFHNKIIIIIFRC